jgi:hypothetical protein
VELHCIERTTLMLLAHAAALAGARSCLAALADNAGTIDASSAYERVLIDLDRIYRDDVPALDYAGFPDDHDALIAVTVSAIEGLVTHGVDDLHIELLLAALADAQALDEH